VGNAWRLSAESAGLGCSLIWPGEAVALLNVSVFCIGADPLMTEAERPTGPGNAALAMTGLVGVIKRVPLDVDGVF
jgi:hypothetical protein